MSTVTVRFSGFWKMVATAEEQLTEWKYEKRPLLVPVASGAAPATVWLTICDDEQMYFTVETKITANAVVDAVRVTRSKGTEPSSCFSGRFFIYDIGGERNVAWRVKMIDYDDQTGGITKQLDEVEFSIAFGNGGLV